MISLGELWGSGQQIVKAGTDRADGLTRGIKGERRSGFGLIAFGDGEIEACDVMFHSSRTKVELIACSSVRLGTANSLILR